MWWRRGTRGIGDRKFPFSGSPQQIFQAGHVASLEGGLLELIEGLEASLVRWAHPPLAARGRPRNPVLQPGDVLEWAPTGHRPLLSQLGDVLEFPSRSSGTSSNGQPSSRSRARASEGPKCQTRTSAHIIA